ncbi:phage/plasmid replication protein [Ideonella sp. B508-1]|uniref:phage/plasmid replication domain-containing protein n=1 Tax=Ideonella sp. B508-1 TaxID=137716 RepID=UPI00058FE3E9
MRSRSEILGRRRFGASAITGLPKHLRRTYEAFRTGKNIRQTMSRATLYRHRADLLKHGIDIAAPLPAELLDTAILGAV